MTEPVTLSATLSLDDATRERCSRFVGMQILDDGYSIMRDTPDGLQHLRSFQEREELCRRIVDAVLAGMKPPYRSTI